jgi:dephospho-CoA kinase
VALLGPLGAGKSTVARCFARHGACVIDGDALGHEALRTADIRQAIVQRWGPQVVGADGQIDRRALGRLVFAEAAQRDALQRLVFPYIERRLRQEIARAQADPACRFVVIDAAILLEAGWAEPVDRFVYVEAPDHLRYQRLRQRSGWTDPEIAQREAAQWPPERKRAVAHATLLNNGDESALQQQVDALVQRWQLADPCLTTGQDKTMT